MDSRCKIIAQRRAELGYSQSQLGKLVGLSQQQIGRIENGSPLTLDNAKKIADVLGIDKMLLLPDGFIGAHMNGINISAEKLTSWLKPSKDVAVIDILDVSACCGDGAEVLSEKPVGNWTVPMLDFKSFCTTTPDNIKMIRAVGDSMTPTINDGDWILVDISNQQAVSDGIYLIKMSTGLAIKRIQGSLTDEVSIISDNNKYTPITAKIGNVIVIGRVVYTLNAKRL